MTISKRKIILFLFLMLFVSIKAQGEILTLKSGRSIEGRIVKKTEHYLMFRDQATGQVEGVLLEDIETIAQGVQPSSRGIEQKTVDAAASLQAPKAISQRTVPAESDSNVLRIYGTEILDENASSDQYDYSDTSTFYVKKEKDNPEDILEKWLKKNIQSAPFLIGSIAAFFLLYILACYPFYLIAKKTETSNPNLAWFPICNLYLLCKIADRPGWWLILMFIPFVNIIIFIVIWMDIAVACGKPSWAGILILVPVVNFFLQWYLALCKMEGVSFSQTKKVAMIDEEREKKAKEQALYEQIVPTQKSDTPKRF